MPSFGRKSKERLLQCDQRLQLLCFELIQVMDVTILCGHRDKDEQNKLFKEGKSKLEWPYSKHNRYPSIAVDVAPYPIDWDDKKRFFMMAGLMFGLAKTHGIKIRWGGDWDGDMNFEDQSFNDLPHFELIEG